LTESFRNIEWDDVSRLAEVLKENSVPVTCNTVELALRSFADIEKVVNLLQRQGLTSFTLRISFYEGKVETCNIQFNSLKPSKTEGFVVVSPGRPIPFG
jgi:hypothetical protein